MIETDIAVGAELRITCAKDDLVQGLGLVARAVSTRTSMQILSGILLEAEGGELRLAATDMELSLRASVPAQVEGDGAVVLPGRTLVDIARLLPEDEVTIEHRPAESVVHVTSGDRELHAAHVTTPRTSRGCRSSRRPDVHGRPRVAARDDRPRRARRLTGRVAPGADRRARPVHRRQARDGRDRLVPLAVKETTLSGAGAGARGDRAEPRAPGAGSRLARRRRRDRGRRPRQPGAVLDVDGVWLTTRRIDGQFPNYRQLLPERFEYELTLPRGELLDVVRRAAVMIQRATPLAAALRGRRADRHRADARRRRVAGVAAGRLHGRPARDRLQRGLPARRDRVGRGRRRAA